MSRSILAIAFGFVFIAVLSIGADRVLKSTMPAAFSPAGRVDSVPVLLVIIGYVFVFSMTGCYLTARFAPDRPLQHALVVGLLGLVLSVAGTVVFWESAPAWYHLTSIALVLPAAWLGGRLRAMQFETHPPRT